MKNLLDEDRASCAASIHFKQLINSYEINGITAYIILYFIRVGIALAMAIYNERPSEGGRGLIFQQQAYSLCT